MAKSSNLISSATLFTSPSFRLRLARIFVDLGVAKIRLTGGEPLVRAHVTDLVERISAIDPTLDLTLTTNGALLAPVAKDLAKAGLHRITVSLDSLDPEGIGDLQPRRLTAQRREQKLTDVGASITALPDQLIEETRITQIENVAAAVPKVDIKEQVPGAIPVVGSEPRVTSAATALPAASTSLFSRPWASYSVRTPVRPSGSITLWHDVHAGLARCCSICARSESTLPSGVQPPTCGPVARPHRPCGRARRSRSGPHAGRPRSG